MVDYTKATGSAGTMLIRDLGYQVQFHLRSADSQTKASALPWSALVNGQTSSGTVNYPSGSPWAHVATFDVGSNQTVRFSIGNTGTSGFGGPTDFEQAIERGNRPDPPSNVGFTEIGISHLVYQFSGNGDGGNPIIRWEYQFWPTPDDNAPWAEAPSSGIVRVDSLPPGAVYWARARAINARGASDPSAWISARTLAGPNVKVGGVWRKSIAYVKVGGQWRMALCYVKVGNEWRLAGA